jgi:hypothetical protein
MAFNGSGVFNRLYNWVTDKTNNVKIQAARMDAEFDGIATALSNCVTADGQTTATAVVPFAVGLRVSDGSVGTPSIGFTSDTNTGFYRIGADNLGLSLGGALACDWSTTAVTITSTDAGAATGPLLKLYRNSASPAASDILGAVQFLGQDDGGGSFEYGRIGAYITNPADAAEAATLRFSVATGGTLASELELTSAALVPATSDGLALGTSSLMWADGFFASGAVLNFNAGDVTVTHSANALAFAGGSSGYSFDALFDVSGAAAGQIKFPASQNASADANTLDDYEEGTFTPTLTFGGAAVGMTFTTQSGRYQKIGNRVDFRVEIVLSAKGSSTGAAVVGGLPFTSANVSTPVLMYLSGGATLTGQHLQPLVATGTDTVLLRYLNSATNANLTDTHFAATTQIILAGCYEATA